MRHTDFWARMEAHFGSAYSHVWADQTVIAALNHLTVNQALHSGVAPKVVWRAVWAFEEMPLSER